MTLSEIIAAGAAARPDLAAYVVAVKDSHAGVWVSAENTGSGIPTSPSKMDIARSQYDLGVVEVLQQRVGDAGYLLLAVPRKMSKTREDYETFAYAAREYANAVGLS